MKVLMTLDAVGGVWRYALDLASGLTARGVRVVLAGLGPQPSAEQSAEARAVGPLEWGEAPLDWMAGAPDDLAGVAPWIDALATKYGVDLLHLNLPTQAVGLRCGLPVLTVSHSCLATWFAAVRGTAVPQDMAWQAALTAEGLAAADLIVAPTRAHAEAVTAAYGMTSPIEVVHNSSQIPLPRSARAAEIVAVGRWWDDGKNGAALDTAAEGCAWPVTLLGATDGPNGARIALNHARASGSLPHPQVMARICRAGIFCAPSLYEPFGLSVLEAARAATPLVLADIPVFRELWDGAAVFVDPRNPSDLRAALNGVAKDGALRARLGAAAEQRANRYQPQTQHAAMLRLYRQLASQGARALTPAG